MNIGESGLIKHMAKILMIPDCQVKEGVPLDYLKWVGKYIVHKRPDVVVQIGDFCDMESLSSYDVGKRSFEGRRYKTDIDVAHHGMELLLSPLWEYQKEQRKAKEKQYKPRMVLTLGNHCERINKVIDLDPKLEGTISINDLKYKEFGWEVFPFLQPVTIEGVAFCHYFPSGIMGRPCTSARALLTKMHMSCVAGHQQGRDIAYGKRADGTEITTIIAGSYYQHDESYLNPFTNTHWRGCFMLHEVKNGSFDDMAISLNYLQSKYGS